MSSLDAPQFRKESQKIRDFAPAYIFVGEEESMIADSYLQFKKLFFARYGNENLDFNLEILDGENEEAERVIESCQALPFGTEKRLVVLRRLEKMEEESREKLADYLKSPNPAATLVLLWNVKLGKSAGGELWKRVNALGVVVLCVAPNDWKRTEWISEKVGQSGKRISPEAALFLSAEGGQSLRELGAEIEKLVLFIGEKAEIELADARETMSFRPGRSAWDFADQLRKGDIKKAGRILKDCLDRGEEPVKMLNLFASVCRRNFAAGADGPLFKELKEADLALKSGHGRESAIFEKLLRRIESSRNDRGKSYVPTGTVPFL